MKKSRRKRKSPPLASATVILSPEWQRFWRSMQRIIARDFLDGRASATEVSEESTLTADLIAQAYLKALRRAVPKGDETPVLPGVALNISERLLLAHIRTLNEMLCQLSRAGRWHACEELWDQAYKLVTVFSELALANPEPFKNKARGSLFMPSLRVPPMLLKSRKRRRLKWNDPFVRDSAEIAKAIELSVNAVGTKISDNQSRLGGLCARLVGECVHEIKRARAFWALYFTPYGRTPVWPSREQVEQFREMSMDDLIASIGNCAPVQEGIVEDHVRFFCMQAGCGKERLDFLLLPELTGQTAKDWWKGAIEKMTEDRFPQLLKQSVWVRELKKVSSGTEADMRKELKDYCRDKVKQFV